MSILPTARDRAVAQTYREAAAFYEPRIKALTAEVERLTVLLEHSINLTDNETLKTYSILKNELASCYDPGEHELMTALVSKFVQKPSKELTERKRYSNTFCSQCGVSFGPGNSGYSHCADHEAPPTKNGYT